MDEIIMDRSLVYFYFSIHATVLHIKHKIVSRDLNINDRYNVLLTSNCENKSVI